MIITLLTIWLGATLFIYNSLKNKNNNLSYFFLLISLVLLLLTNSINNKNKNDRSAIIFSSTIKVMSAPSDQSTKLFTLHLGTKVKINDQIENWVNIKIANGKKGWILTDNLKEI